MGQALVEKVLARIDKTAELYHRLLLVVAPSGSGKTTALQQVARRKSAPLLNLNLELSARLLDPDRGGSQVVRRVPALPFPAGRGASDGPRQPCARDAGPRARRPSFRLDTDASRQPKKRFEGYLDAKAKGNDPDKVRIVLE